MHKSKITMLLLGLSIFVIYNDLDSAPLSFRSKKKIGISALISGSVAAGFSTLIAKLSDNSDNFRRSFYSKNSCNFCQRLKSVLFHSTVGAISSLVGGYVTYRCFTPEGKLAQAQGVIRDVDRELLTLIDDLAENAGSLEKIVLYHKGKHTYPLMVVFEYLNSEMSNLLRNRDRLDFLEADQERTTHLRGELSVAQEHISEMLPIIEKGMRIIKLDQSFDVKWQAYMLEKQLRLLQRELSLMNLNNSLNCFRPLCCYHYHYL